MYAVIFKTKRTLPAPDDYIDLNKKLVEALSDNEDFLGIESVANEDGQGISISYWSNLEAISDWKKHNLHLEAQQLGKQKWYEYYSVEVCEILRSYDSQTSAEANIITTNRK